MGKLSRVKTYQRIAIPLKAKRGLCQQCGRYRTLKEQPGYCRECTKAGAGEH